MHKDYLLLLLGYSHCVQHWLRERGWDRVPPGKRRWLHVTSHQSILGLPWDGTVWLQIGPETKHADRMHEELRRHGARELQEVSAIDLMGSLVSKDGDES